MKQRTPAMKNRRFLFFKKSGLCEFYMVLCCANGGNKYEYNQRTMAWEYSTARR